MTQQQRAGASLPVSTKRRDWFRILRDLMQVGVSMTQVARKCNRDVSAVRGWANGSEPKESDARVVLALYAKHLPLKYLEHQKAFEIRAEIEATVETGETRQLPFVG